MKRLFKLFYRTVYVLPYGRSPFKRKEGYIIDLLKIAKNIKFKKIVNINVNEKTWDNELGMWKQRTLFNLYVFKLLSGYPLLRLKIKYKFL